AGRSWIRRSWCRCIARATLSLLLVMAEPLPTVRTMGPSPVICRHPGESRDPVSGSFDIHVLVPLGSCRAGCFPFGESSQNHCAGHDGFSNVVLPKLPAVLAERRAAPNSHIRVLKHAALAPPFGRAPRHHAMARFSRH